MSNCKEKLFTEFQAPTKQEWLDKIQVDLKGADFNKKLVWRTNEGFDMQPFYRREDIEGLATPNALPGEFPFVRGNKKDDNVWRVRQNIVADDAKAANAKALDILNKGIDSLGFKIKGSDVSAEFVDTLLEGICLECIDVNFSTCQCHTLELAQILVAYFEKKGYDKENINGSIAFDPIEKILMKGKDATEMVAKAKELVELLKDYRYFRCIAVNSEALNNSGAYIVQELGYALAWGNEYLQQMVEAGVEPTLAASKIKFNMGISENYFMEIAKFRAFRMLWAKIVNTYDVPEEECYTYIMATTANYNKTLFDSYVNLLRTQTEAMSSALAGVESMVVTPFDAPYEEPTEFSERLARNQQLMLKEENHFSKIVDVAAGSYYIEQLTQSLAGEAWKLFLSVEKEGGFLAATLSGSVQNTLNATNDDRHKKAAQRKEFILGSNQFPNFNEVSEGKTPLTCCCKCGAEEATAFPKLNTTRLASEFEDLRLQTEKAAKRPVAFMLTIGDLKWRQARAQFSCNFLASAGYQVIDNLGFPTVEEGVEAAVKAGADIVVLCSSDEEYAQLAVPAYQALNGRALFVVAGAPACTDDLKAAGIEYFIHVRVNQLETLKEFNAKLGI